MPNSLAQSAYRKGTPERKRIAPWFVSAFCIELTAIAARAVAR
jgi:hypothetical protein